ncbi:type VI secretion system baseplate subunit TssG [Buttiauxella gaviniae]|uniref:Type VI secretion system baseplate subunit TssG n=1 Tax=Buttiauxella gaviniae TaxID=82990 RepID=A0ABV3NP83_9ENTR
MAGKNRSARADLTMNNPFHDVCRYNFYALVEAIYKQTENYQVISLQTEPIDEALRFEADASIAFPKSDVSTLVKNKAGQFVMTTTFLGLHGSQSPLPGYYLDNLAWGAAQGETKLGDFLDMFTHRWTQFIYHIWRKYRYYVCFRNGGTDAFSQRMYSLVGLGSESIRSRLVINHSKMLAYAGALANPGRSSEVICSLVSHCFDLEDVTLHGWQLRKVDIESEQQNRLGQRVMRGSNKFIEKSVLGENFSIGSRIPDRSGKFLLCINNLTRDRFLSFLPNGINFLPLTLFVAFILRDQFAWDLRLGIAPQQVGGMTLGNEQNSLLGWTSFLGKPNQYPHVTITVRT